MLISLFRDICIFSLHHGKWTVFFTCSKWLSQTFEVPDRTEGKCHFVYKLNISLGCVVGFSLNQGRMKLLILAALLGLSLAQFNPNTRNGRTAIVHLFEWRWADIAAECERYLGPNGFGGVQVFLNAAL